MHKAIENAFMFKPQALAPAPNAAPKDDGTAGIDPRRPRPIPQPREETKGQTYE